MVSYVFGCFCTHGQLWRGSCAPGTSGGRHLNISCNHTHSQLYTSWLKMYGIYILTVVSVIFLLCLALFLFCFRSHRQKKQGLPNNERQQQRPQERLNLATNGLETTPDIVADDRLLEDRQTETWTSVAGDLQEVTYAQLDHHYLTQRAVGAVTPQSTDIMTESSTYAAIIRR
uniref:leukocyte-associated immunoglobulin-like receptor 1 isoform X2 n=1 Tax=Arvicanthis niloticus TaxID=61156 RepID=UPI001486191D|nr:leukocyte-associated immunoglobulin-like receptor 1 isoform X2 [Arvicanthis niloticus]